MAEKAEDLDRPPVVGRRYLVRCLFVPLVVGMSRKGLWWPIRGGEHSDAELGAPEPHYHLYADFLTPYQVAAVEGLREGTVHGTIIFRTDRRHPSRGLPTSVLLAPYAPEPPVLRSRVCHGVATPYPVEATRTMARSLSSYHVPLGACRRCPHRGFDLRQVAPDGGVITCPGHGLRWTEDGRPCA